MPELLKGGLMLASHALVMLGDADDPEHMFVRLHSVTLGPDAAAVGRAIDSLDLGAEISMIRRGRNRVEPAPDLMLEASDVVVLRGTGEAVALGEARLLK